jgi:hypothetical protein
MLRKTLIAVSAVAALGAVTLAPTTAAAGGGGKFFKGGGKFHFHKHVGWGAYPAYGFGHQCFFEKRITPFGWKVVKVCSWY